MEHLYIFAGEDERVDENLSGEKVKHADTDDFTIAVGGNARLTAQDNGGSGVNRHAWIRGGIEMPRFLGFV